MPSRAEPWRSKAALAVHQTRRDASRASSCCAACADKAARSQSQIEARDASRLSLTQYACAWAVTLRIDRSLIAILDACSADKCRASLCVSGTGRRHEAPPWRARGRCRTPGIGRVQGPQMICAGQAQLTRRRRASAEPGTALHSACYCACLSAGGWLCLRYGGVHTRGARSHGEWRCGRWKSVEGGCDCGPLRRRIAAVTVSACSALRVCSATIGGAPGGPVPTPLDYASADPTD